MARTDRRPCLDPDPADRLGATDGGMTEFAAPPLSYPIAAIRRIGWALQTEA